MAWSDAARRAALEVRRRNKKPKVMYLKVSDLIQDVPGGGYPLGANEKAIRLYRKMFKAGQAKQMDPVIVRRKGRSLFTIIDGNHRTMAASREGISRIRAVWGRR
jgi:hypothetical protein